MPLLALLLGTVGWTPDPCTGMDHESEHAVTGEPTSVLHAHPAPAMAGMQVAGHAAGHGMAHGAPTQASDAAETVDAPADSSDGPIPPCAMMGHCTATLPGVAAETTAGNPILQVSGTVRAGWQLHPAPPSHLTPPPRT